MIKIKDSSQNVLQKCVSQVIVQNYSSGVGCMVIITRDRGVMTAVFFARALVVVLSRTLTSMANTAPRFEKDILMRQNVFPIQFSSDRVPYLTLIYAHEKEEGGTCYQQFHDGHLPKVVSTKARIVCVSSHSQSGPFQMHAPRFAFG